MLCNLWERNYDQVKYLKKTAYLKHFTLISQKHGKHFYDEEYKLTNRWIRYTYILSTRECTDTRDPDIHLSEGVEKCETGAKGCEGEDRSHIKFLGEIAFEVAVPSVGGSTYALHSVIQILVNNQVVLTTVGESTESE